MKKKTMFVDEPQDTTQFTEDFNKIYSAWSGVYDFGVRVFPFYRRWLNSVIPHVQGPRVLEISFGTGYLLTQLAAQYETFGIDYNQKFVDLAQSKLTKKGILADIRQGDVQALPYEDEYFDSIVNTMAFMAYPNGFKAMSEMHRVLRTEGKLILVDVGFPQVRKGLGMQVAKIWISLGDIIRDMPKLFDQFKFEYSVKEIGGFGTVHLYIAGKTAPGS